MIDFLRYNVRVQPLDPVNLVFEMSANTSSGAGSSSRTLLDEVVDVLDNDGWGTGMQSHEYLLESDEWFRQERLYRTKGPLWNRYHVRFWRDGDNRVLASAHKERFKKWPPGHEVESFDAAKKVVQAVFDSDPGWTVDKDFEDFGGLTGRIEDPPANGKATLIRKS